MRTDPDELFEIGIVCLYPNVFEPRPAMSLTRDAAPKLPTYSVRFDVGDATMDDALLHKLMIAYSQYLPNITITANRPPILTPTGPGAYDMFVQAMQVARERRLHLDAMLIGMRATAQVCWFTPRMPRIVEREVLSFRGLMLDPFDLYAKATAD